MNEWPFWKGKITHQPPNQATGTFETEKTIGCWSLSGGGTSLTERPERWIFHPEQTGEDEPNLTGAFFFSKGLVETTKLVIYDYYNFFEHFIFMKASQLPACRFICNPRGSTDHIYWLEMTMIFVRGLPSIAQTIYRLWLLQTFKGKIILERIMFFLNLWKLCFSNLLFLFLFGCCRFFCFFFCTIPRICSRCTVRVNGSRACSAGLWRLLAFFLGEWSEKSWRESRWTSITRWWQLKYFLFPSLYTWGRFPFWLIFFKWFETIN